MLIRQINREDPEVILHVARNVDGSGSITTGYGCHLNVAAASMGNNDVHLSDDADSASFAGVAKNDIAINAYGLVTLWGYAASVAISQSVGSWTITSGDVLRHAAVAGTFTSVILPEDLSTHHYKYVIAAGGLADTISNPEPFVSGIVYAI